MRNSLTVVILVIAVAVWSPAGAPASSGAEAAHASAAIGSDGFLSPDRKTWCSGNAKEVGCVSLPSSTPHDNHGAIVKRGGRVILCPDGSAGLGWACFQNFDEKAPVLRYGRRAEVGPFRCTSTRQGITCTVRASGRGFRIDRREVRSLVPRPIAH